MLLTGRNCQDFHCLQFIIVNELFNYISLLQSLNNSLKSTVRLCTCPQPYPGQAHTVSAPAKGSAALLRAGVHSQCDYERVCSSTQSRHIQSVLIWVGPEHYPEQSHTVSAPVKGSGSLPWAGAHSQCSCERVRSSTQSRLTVSHSVLLGTKLDHV